MKRIEELRKRKGLSQKKLAEMANISAPYLSALEKGKKKNPTLQVLQNIAKALEVEIKDLH